MTSTATLSASTTLSVSPGGTASADLRVANTGPTTERFALRVARGPAEWVWCNPSTLVIEAGAEATVRVVCQPPRSPSTQMGPTELAIAVSGTGQEPPTMVDVPLDVGSFFDLGAGLDPREAHARGGARYDLTVDNRGNATETLAVRPSAAGEDLEVSADPPELVLAPGASGRSVVEVRPLRRHWLGRPATRSFEVAVEPASAAAVRLTGRLVTPPRVSGRAGAGGLVGVVVAAVVVAAVLASGSSGPAHPATAVTSPTCTGAGHLAHDANGQTRPNVVEPDNFSFLFLDNNCSPARWNPCQPLHYYVDTTGATPANLADLTQAIATVSRDTGLRFVSDGNAASAADVSGIEQAAQQQHRWAPISINWLHQGPGNGATEVLGGGRPEIVAGVLVTGSIFFNADAHEAGGAPFPDGFGTGVTWGRVMLHELGHVVGLGHVTGTDEIMHEPLNDQAGLAQSTYGLGDLTGLRLLGRSAGCVAEPSVQPLPGRNRPVPTDAAPQPGGLPQ
ncbi:MAG: hypothetical protein ACRDY0_01435 [Acidimicrobiales bacterium]